MNCAVYSGKLVNDPVLRTNADGVKFATFELAVHRPMTREVCDYIDCAAREEKAEFVLRNFKKGSIVEVRGIMTTRRILREGGSWKAVELRVEEANFGRSRQE